jgi:hypothetical protein
LVWYGDAQNEILGCWALTFPNVGFIVTFKALGDVFQSQVFWTAHAVFTFTLLAVFIVLFTLTVYAIIKGEILIAKEKDLWGDMHPEEREALAKDQMIDFEVTHMGRSKEAEAAAEAEGQYRMHEVDLEKGAAYPPQLEVAYGVPGRPARPYGNF